MRMTLQAQQDEEERLLLQFRKAVEEQKPNRALLIANQAVAEARVEMMAIVANAQLNHSLYPSSALLAHIATRRKAQTAELKVFLGDLHHHITDAAGRTSKDATQHAVAAYSDFLEGWLGKANEARIDPASLKLASAEAAVPSASTSDTTGQASAGHGAASDGGAHKAARTNLCSSASAGSGSSSTTTSGMRGAIRIRVSQICVFQRNFPCSASVLGSTLGIVGAPPCTKCGNGAHYHGECPQEWGRIGNPLPGFTASGTRIAMEWTKSNEPIQKTMQALVKFFGDESQLHRVFTLPGQSRKGTQPGRLPGAGGRGSDQTTMPHGGAGASSSALRKPEPRAAAIEPPIQAPPITRSGKCATFPSRLSRLAMICVHSGSGDFQKSTVVSQLGNWGYSPATPARSNVLQTRPTCAQRFHNLHRSTRHHFSTRCFSY